MEDATEGAYMKEQRLDSFLNSKFYEIRIERSEIQEITVCVQAKNEQEAIDTAIDKAKNTAFPRGNYAQYTVEKIKRIGL
jgi:hypothetical protein